MTFLLKFYLIKYRHWEREMFRKYLMETNGFWLSKWREKRWITNPNTLLSLKQRSTDREQSHPQRPLENICFPIICQRNRVYAPLSFFYECQFFAETLHAVIEKKSALSCAYRACAHTSMHYMQKCGAIYRIK